VEKPEVPSTYGANIEKILYCVSKFLEAATALNFDTGDELFTNFRRIPLSTAKDDWDHVTQRIRHHFNEFGTALVSSPQSCINHTTKMALHATVSQQVHFGSCQWRCYAINLYAP
jgi:hypothetical protein